MHQEWVEGKISSLLLDMGLTSMMLTALPCHVNAFLAQCLNSPSLKSFFPRLILMHTHRMLSTECGCPGTMASSDMVLKSFG